MRLVSLGERQNIEAFEASEVAFPLRVVFCGVACDDVEAARLSFEPFLSAGKPPAYRMVRGQTGLPRLFRLRPQACFSMASMRFCLLWMRIFL